MLTLKPKFGAQALYQVRQESMKGFLTKRWSFWLALFSCIAFLVGNMVGQHGWQAFWKSVWGKEAEQHIQFDGTVSPLPYIADPLRWRGDRRTDDFSDVPDSQKIALPKYREVTQCDERKGCDRSIYSVRYMGDYERGCDNCGSHPGVDILTAKGTPVVAVANGIVERIEERSWGFGNTVVLKIPNAPHPDYPNRTMTLYASYGHLGNISVTPGQVVAKGQQIAFTGQTGFATAPHLDFQIIKDNAPFYPYWTFTTTEATEQGLSFIDAVNTGLGKERGERHAVSPIAYVQSYEDWATPAPAVIAESTPEPEVVILSEDAEEPVVRIANAPEQSREPTIVEKLSPKEIWKQLRARMRARRAQRIARLDARRSRLTSLLIDAETQDVALPEEEEEVSAIITLPEPEEIVEHAVEVATQEIASTAEIDIPMPNISPVAKLSVLHDGEFTDEWEEIVIFARDGEGNFLRTVTFDGELTLQAYYGDADFAPSVLTAEQFDEHGRAIVKMQPRGHKTIIPGIYGVLRAQGEPMVHANVLSARMKRRGQEG